MKFKKISAHLCLILGTAVIVIRILDWFNPLMDFTGHAGLIVTGLGIVSVLLALSVLKSEK